MGVLWFFGVLAKLYVLWSVWCVSLCGCKVAFCGWCAFVCMSDGFCWLFKCGSVWVVRCVDLETQKEGKKSTPKGREAKVTFTVLAWGNVGCKLKVTSHKRICLCPPAIVIPQDACAMLPGEFPELLYPNL